MSAMQQQELVALIGPPNAGKTTLYNWLTNSKFKTVNYPGATVEYSIGSSAPSLGSNFLFMDTPGTYSLFPKSSDEEVTLKAIYERHDHGFIQNLIIVVDGTQLERHLLLVEQAREAGFSFVIAITMADLLSKNDIKFLPEVLEREFECPVIMFDGSHGKGLEQLIAALKALTPKQPKKLPAWSKSEFDLRVKKIKDISISTLGGLKKVHRIYDSTAKMDHFLLHPVLGVVVFFLIMSTLFSSIFWLAKPFMNLIDQGFSWSIEVISNYGAGSLWSDFLAHGVVASFGALAVFIPQIFILFFGIGILESTGYLARAATLIDKPFSKLGLSGRSFIPILSGFACAVPAMMATRNISSKRERMITNFVVPFMTCSARLPVYALLIGFLFKNSSPLLSGAVLALLYLGSLVLGAIAATILNRILAKTEKGFFMMELPLYRKPKWRVLLQQSISRTKGYIVKAGPIIFTFAVLIWVGTTFPNYNSQNPTQRLQTSYFAKVGQVVEPVFVPMGLDWRVGVGLMSAFAAREVFVSSMAVVFNITDKNERSQSEGLLNAMTEAKNKNGKPLFTFITVLGLIIFFMIAMQCMSTFSIAVHESGSLKFALTQLIVLNIVAYIVTIIIVQGLGALL